ncbi:hypothetical protein HAX54_009798 [Datura stramonium]|uniref:Uncharacterized protein n=1 Tax=Datura stramonium TaxID=4076 RepID=A0ABS8WZI6_DATST|nr:hypothetical protein [Datura stramonium]
MTEIMKIYAKNVLGNTSLHRDEKLVSKQCDGGVCPYITDGMIMTEINTGRHEINWLVKASDGEIGLC